MPRRRGASRLNGKRWDLSVPVPLPPPPPGGNGSVQVTFYHARTATEGAASLVRPYLQKVLRAAPADFPAGTTPTFFKGSTAVPTQAGYKATTWPDGSWRCGQIMALSPDTFAPNGQTGDRNSYTIKPVAGSGASSPRFDFNGWVGANNLRMVFRTNLADLTDDTRNFYVSLQEIVQAGIVEGTGTGSGYPLSSYRVDESGNVALRFKARGYLRRISDGAYHTQIVGEFWVTAIGANSFRVTPRIGMPAGIETKARNSLQTVGAIANTDIVDISGVWEIWNNGVKTHTFGGPTDWRKVTLPASPVDVTTSRIKFTNTAGDSNRPRGTLGYVFESTGALPTGLNPGIPYFVYPTSQPAQWVNLWFQRGFMSSDPGSIPSVVQLWQPNMAITGIYAVATGYYATTTATAIPANTHTVQRWVTTASGTTGTTRPVPSGNNEVIDGTVKWMPVSPVLTDQGTGTLTAWPVVTTSPASWQVGADVLTGNELWIGTGPAPELEVLDDITYLMRDAKAVPPYDTTISPIFPNSAAADIDGYSVNEQTSPSDLNIGGDNPGDMRIGWLNHANSLALLAQNNLRIQRSCRFEALGWQDRPSVFEDPRAFMPICSLQGMNNTPGVRFPGLGGLFPDFPLTWGGSALGPVNAAVGPSKYGSVYPPRNAFPLESSHMPACWIMPYHATGNAMWIEAAIELANGSHMSMVSDSVNNPTLFPWARSGQRGLQLTPNGRRYAATQLLFGQIRSIAWSTRALFTCDAVLPTSHPMRAYFTSMINDATDCYFAAKDWLQANQPGCDFGLSIRPCYNSAVQLWECAYQLISFAHEGGQDVHPRMRDVAEDTARFLFSVYDDANGGNSGLGGFNWVRYCIVTSMPTAGTQITISTRGGNQGGTGPFPPTIVYTTPTPAPADMTAFAKSVVAFINAQTSWTGMGYSATWDTGGVFLIRCPNAFYNPSRHDGDTLYDFTSNLFCSQNGFIVVRPDEVGKIRSYFSSTPEMLRWNLGAGWPQTNSTTQVMDGTDALFAVPHWFFPWATTSYPVAARCAVNTAAQMGIRNLNPGGSSAIQIATRFNDRFRTTTNGPPIFTSGTTSVVNFAIRTFADQAAHPGG